MPEPTRVEIVRLGAQGDGVANGPDGEAHVPDALPGECVARLPDGRWQVVGDPSAERRSVPLCPHVARCGGCSVQHMGDPLYRSWKEGLLTTALAQRGLAVVASPMLSVPLASRRRATFAGIWNDGVPKLGFHRRESHDVEPIAACAILRPSIVSALPALARLAAAIVPRDADFRLSVLAADNGLDVAIDVKASSRAARNAPTVASLAQAAKATRLTLAGEPFLLLMAPRIKLAGVTVMLPPGAFLQAAAETDVILADQVLSHIGKAKRVADLFAGLGTLSLALATRARVLAVDSDASLLGALGKAAAGAQGLKPIETLRRDLFRDPLSPRELDGHDAVVLDPPRAGAAAQCEALARSKVRRVVMVSCNPATLARDARTLVDGGYTLESATPIDQFLFTAHLEVVAVFTRRR